MSLGWGLEGVAAARWAPCRHGARRSGGFWSGSRAHEGHRDLVRLPPKAYSRVQFPENGVIAKRDGDSTPV